MTPRTHHCGGCRATIECFSSAKVCTHDRSAKVNGEGPFCLLCRSLSMARDVAVLRRAHALVTALDRVIAMVRGTMPLQRPRQERLKEDRTP